MARTKAQEGDNVLVLLDAKKLKVYYVNDRLIM